MKKAKKIGLFFMLLVLISSCTTTPTSSAEEDKEVYIYAINDFHGAIKETSSRAGILKIGSYLKNKKEQNDAIIINSGDYWQGSIDSNYNRGKLLTEVANEIQFDCLTLGNHEFDWGQQYIATNRNIRSDSGYQVPFLAANVYRYDINTRIVGEYANVGDKYTIRTLKNGLKVGIIGVIGSTQLASITSHLVEDITFIDPNETIKEVSDELRMNEHCDIVLASCHADQDDIDSSITQVSPNSHKKYVDAVFCAHTHVDEKKKENGVPFIQSACYGEKIGVVKLIEDNGDWRCDVYESVNAKRITSGVTIDSRMASIVSRYGEETAEVSAEILNQSTGYFSSSLGLPNMVCGAMADYAIKNNIDVDYTICNNARTSFERGDITFGDVYQALPFDNEVVIIETTGERIMNRALYNSFYRLDPNPLEPNKTYRVAVIDYLAFHRGTNRNYDHFPNHVLVGKYSKAGMSLYTYRDLTADYLRNLNLTLSPDNYLASSSNPYSVYYDVELLEEAVVLPPNPYVG